jgi:hypothetical protein
MKAAAPGTPTHGKYALDWGELLMDWAPKPLIYHGGSNQKNLAHIWVEPRRDVADAALFARAPELYVQLVSPTRGGKGRR